MGNHASFTTEEKQLRVRGMAPLQSLKRTEIMIRFGSMWAALRRWYHFFQTACQADRSNKKKFQIPNNLSQSILSSKFVYFNGQK